MSERHAAFVIPPRTGPQRRAGHLPSGGSIADGPTAKSAPAVGAPNSPAVLFPALAAKWPCGPPFGRLFQPTPAGQPLTPCVFCTRAKACLHRNLPSHIQTGRCFFRHPVFLYACRQNSNTFSKMLWRRPHARGTAPFLSFCVTSVKPHKKLFKCLSHFPKLLFCYCVPFSDSVY